MYTVLLVVHVIITLSLIVVVLVQRSDTDGLGGLGGGGASLSGFMTGRAKANLLTRATAILAFGFILTSLVLGMLIANDRDNGSIATRIDAQQKDLEVPQPDAVKPETPAPGAAKEGPPATTPATSPPAAAPVKTEPKEAPAVPKPE